MKYHAQVIALLFTVLGSGCAQVSSSRLNELHNSNDHGNPAAGEVNISGAEAEAFMNSLLAAGVKADGDLVQVQNIQCSIPVIPNAKPICTLTNYDGSLLNPRDGVAQVLHQTLLDHGGALNKPGVIGAHSHVAADKVVCLAKGDNRSEVGCSFFVGGLN